MLDSCDYWWLRRELSRVVFRSEISVSGWLRSGVLVTAFVLRPRARDAAFSLLGLVAEVAITGEIRDVVERALFWRLSLGGGIAPADAKRWFESSDHGRAGAVAQGRASRPPEFAAQPLVAHRRWFWAHRGAPQLAAGARAGGRRSGDCGRARGAASSRRIQPLTHTTSVWHLAVQLPAFT